MRNYQWGINVPSSILGQEKHESPKCLIEKILSFFFPECVLYVLFSRKLLKMSSKRFCTAEEVAAILVADIPWHENGSDVSDDSSSESDREEFHINEPILTAQGTDQNDQLFESPIESEQEAVVIEEDSTSECLSTSSPEADFEADNNTAKGNPGVDTNESNESIAQNVTQFFNTYNVDQDRKWKKKAKDKFTPDFDQPQVYFTDFCQNNIRKQSLKGVSFNRCP